MVQDLKELHDVWVLHPGQNIDLSMYGHELAAVGEQVVLLEHLPLALVKQLKRKLNLKLF